ncbi:MAG: isocitrate dehydrogenase, NAD-dependent, partial [Myxococcaceae bacterium]|nr:isocitrate dehydrogenase, NAD-dependent [Myxococcaceae bacterium]
MVPASKWYGSDMSDPIRKVTLINGDGIGPEVMGATRKVLEAVKAPLEYEYQDAGSEAASRHGTNLPDATVEAVMRNGVGLKGPTATGIGGGLVSANVAIRKRLDLYASLRPIKSVPNVKTRYENVDLIVVRENTEDLYAGLEHVVVPGVVESLKIITEKASSRICRFAFEHALQMKRKKVTAVHKANIMKLSDGLFLECFRRAAREFPTVQAEEVIVDALCMQLVKDPARYDVMVMENLYGDIISDLCAGLVGGLGVVPGSNIGTD